MTPRPIRPKDEPEVAESSGNASDSKGSKRRAVSSACIPCRKRKSKCDGAQPSCSTCAAVYRTDCSYDADSDHRRKGALKRDIQSLQRQNDALDVIVASLRSLPQSEAIALLHTLRSDADPDLLADSLRTNVGLPSNFANQTLEADFTEPIVVTQSGSEVDTASVTDAQDDAYDRRQPSLSPWFKAPQDSDLIDHLFNLYFSWIHPFYHFFSREHFVSDMTRGRTGFCSAMLVNALLSFACHYSDRPLARVVPNDSHSAGDHFFREAKSLLDKTERPSLTTVQALAIMSVREASHGRDSNAYQYAGRCVRMALEMGLHLSVIGNAMQSSENEVRKVTYWAIFNLETRGAVAFGRPSQLPRAVADVDKPKIADDAESQLWRAYEDTNVSVSTSTELPARLMLFMSQQCKLSEIANDMVNNFYAPSESFTTRRLAAVYAQYQDWYRHLPDAFRLENTTLPYVLVLHMYYYGCVLHLFRPYIKLDLSGANLYPRDTCTVCANEISSLMNALRAMYGLRRVCLPVTSLLLSASTIHLLNLPAEPSSTHLVQGTRDLKAITTNHRFAGRSIEVIRSLATKWSISLPEGLAATTPPPGASGRSGPSPPLSSFWAATIPTVGSTDSMRTQTTPYLANASTHSGSIMQQSSMTPIFSSSPTPMDSQQAPNPFWTPFPAQTMPQRMPVPSQNILPTMPVDFMSLDNQGSHWRNMARSNQQAPYTPQESSSSGRIEEVMEYHNWHWQ